jgi:RNA polymerase sigma factor (sigma-70 family)
MPNSEYFDDEELVVGCLREERMMQEMLYRKYAKTMYNICLAYEPDRDSAKDILQEAFIKVFRSISEYKQQGSLQGWIRRIITNTAIDHFRKVKIEEKRFINIDLVKKDDEPQIHEVYSLNTKDIMNKVQQLPEGARLVFNLFSLEGFNHKEIAEKLGISEGTSKSQLNRARQLLQEWLGEYK